MSMRRIGRNGFTLIELLVSMGIISVLAALLIPAVQSSRASARRVSCKNQLHQLGIALHNYHESFNCFPAGSYVMGSSFPMQTGWGWGAMILPYIEQKPLFDRLDFRQGTATGGNLPLIRTTVTQWRCPSDTGPLTIHCTTPSAFSYELASGNYCGSEGILSVMSQTRIRDILDGTSNTLMVGERLVQPGLNGSLPFTSAWCGQVALATEYDLRSVPHLMPTSVHPLNLSETDPLCFGSRHENGANFTYGDGSVHFISENIDLGVYEALGTSNGREVVEAP